ncbi:MAG TPA: hypothetical protein VMZ11_03730 [Mycobacteriales bacterium]|nr:hypothetical protein [Mycobacteriales bacterium]
MYSWIWHRLPGRLPARTLQALVLLGLAVAALFIWVFPRVEAQLPYNDVTVPGPSTTSGPSSQPTELPAG